MCKALRRQVLIARCDQLFEPELEGNKISGIRYHVDQRYYQSQRKSLTRLNLPLQLT